MCPSWCQAVMSGPAGTEKAAVKGVTGFKHSGQCYSGNLVTLQYHRFLNPGLPHADPVGSHLTGNNPFHLISNVTSV